MRERLEVIHAFASLFFTDKSYLSKGLSYLLFACKTNRILLRIKFYLDKLFIAKFIFLIDDRINKWLTECEQVETVEQTSLELMDFMMIMSDIKLNKFFCDLLDSIRMIAKDDKTESTDRNGSRKKRKHSSEKALPKIE